MPAPPHPATDPPTRRTGSAASVARTLGETAAVFVLYALVAAWYLRPIWRLGARHLPPGEDALFNTYLLAWVSRQLRLGLPDLWGANFFFPFPDALALSDHMLGPGAQALLLEPLTGGPVGGYNALLFLSFALAGTTTWAVLRASGLGRTAAFVGGAAFAFVPYRWEHLSHLQVLIVQWIPPLLWSFDRLLARPSAARAGLFLAFYALHVTSGNYLAFLVHAPLLVLLLNRWSRELFARRSLRVLAPAGLAAAALLAALYHPYVELSGRLGFEREAENFRQFGATLPGQLTPSTQMPYFDELAPHLKRLSPGLEKTAWKAEKALFPGFLPALLAAVGIGGLYGRRGRSADPRPGPLRRRLLAGLLALAAAAFVAADLYSLGWWGRADESLSPDRVYTLLGVVLLAALAAWIGLGRLWTGAVPLAPAGADPWERGLLRVGLATWLLSYPVVFEPLAEVLPGFGQMRSPARAQVFTQLVLAWLAALGTVELARRVRDRRVRALAGAALIAFLLAELAPDPIGWRPAPPLRERPVYGWIAARPEVQAVLELPLRNQEREIPYMWAATRHWKPVANGFSAYTPPATEALRRVCCWPVPDADALERLRDMGVTHVVVHGGALERRWGLRELARWEADVAAGAVPGVRRVYSDGWGDRVFAIGGAPP